MIQRRKLVMTVLAALGLLVVCGIAAVKLLLTEERLAAFARERVKTSLGRELQLGELSLQFRPLPTVQLKNAALGNPSWAEEAHLLHAKSATARLDVSALMQGRLEVASLSIEGLSANLEISSDGRKTWQMRGDPVQSEDAQSLIAPLHLASVELKDVLIRYARHGQPAREWRIEELRAHADSGWKDVNVDARIVQNGIPLEAEARFADLSAAGKADAVSDGKLELTLGSARLSVAGTLPLSGSSGSLARHALTAEFHAQSAKELLGFFGMPAIDLAPIKASVQLQGGTKGSIQGSNLAAEIGHLKLSGEAEIHVAGDKPHYRATLTSGYLDWAQMMRDFGRPRLPPKPPEQLFRDTPLGWRAVSALQAVKGDIILDIQRVQLRSGMELTDLKASVRAGEKLLDIDKFSFFMLDGRASGSLALQGDKRIATLKLDTEKVNLGKWLAARGHKLAVSGGPTDLRASVSAKGLSMKDLAESLNGSVRLSIGPAKLHSKQIQQAETWLIGLAPAFAATEAEHVDLACISAYLPFQNGRAAAEPIGGIRSEASQLLLSGYIDLKRQAMDLRGQVRARSGVSLGVSNIAGSNLKIAGRIGKPSVGLDPESTPGALARIGAAIMTSGVSILATALWDAANPASDPCQITFSANKKQVSSTSRKELSARKTNASDESEAYP